MAICDYPAGNGRRKNGRPGLSANRHGFVLFRAFGHCVLCTVPGFFIVTFMPTFKLLLSPSRVINVVPKGKTQNGGKKDED